MKRLYPFLLVSLLINIETADSACAAIPGTFAYKSAGLICTLIPNDISPCDTLCISRQITDCNDNPLDPIAECPIEFKGTSFPDIFRSKECTADGVLCVEPVGMACSGQGTCDCANEPYGSRLPNGDFLGTNNCPLSTLDGFCFGGVLCIGGDRSLFEGLKDESSDNSEVVTALSVSISGLILAGAGTGLFFYRRNKIQQAIREKNRITINIDDLKNVTFDENSTTTVTDENGNTFIVMKANKKNSEMLF